MKRTSLLLAASMALSVLTTIGTSPAQAAETPDLPPPPAPAMAHAPNSVPSITPTVGQGPDGTTQAAASGYTCTWDGAVLLRTYVSPWYPSQIVWESFNTELDPLWRYDKAHTRWSDIAIAFKCTKGGKKYWGRVQNWGIEGEFQACTSLYGFFEACGAWTGRTRWQTAPGIAIDYSPR